MKFEEMKLGDSISLAEFLPGLSDDPVMATVSEISPSGDFLCFRLTYKGVFIKTAILKKEEGSWVVEQR
jgi:hypothetical protein